MRQPVEAIKGGAARYSTDVSQFPKKLLHTRCKTGQNCQTAKKRFIHEPKVVLSSEELWAIEVLALATGTSSVGVAVAVAYIVAVVAVVVLVVVSIIGVYIQYHALWEFHHSDKICSSEFDWIRPWCKFEMDTVSVSW